MTASSTSSSTSAIERTVGRPATSPPFALTRCSGPEKPAASRLRTTSPPTVPGRRDAPITATEAGRSTCATAATSAARSRSSKRRRASRDSDVGNSNSTQSPDRRTETGNPESWKTWSIRRFSGSTVAVNVSIPAADAACARWASRMVAMPWPCQASATAKATSARSSHADVGAVAHDGVLGAVDRDQRQPASGAAALRAARSRLTPALK